MTGEGITVPRNHAPRTTLHPNQVSIEGVLTRDKFVTHALLTLTIDDEPIELGWAIAECAHRDVFRKDVGDALALGRALVDIGGALIDKAMADAE